MARGCVAVVACTPLVASIQAQHCYIGDKQHTTIGAASHEGHDDDERNKTWSGEGRWR